LVPHERDERWVYVALALLAIAYVIYRYGDSLELPDVSFKGLRKVATTLPYLVATFFGVFFQMFNRRKQTAARKRMEEGLDREGVVRKSENVAIAVGRKRGQSFEADVLLTKAALYVFDTARKRDPMRIPVRRDPGAVFVEDASLLPDASGGPPMLVVKLGGATGRPMSLFTTDSVAWWIDLRGALGKSADVEAELASRRAPEGNVAPTGTF
jgi:hypothetical protein